MPCNIYVSEIETFTIQLVVGCSQLRLLSVLGISRRDRFINETITKTSVNKKIEECRQEYEEWIIQENGWVSTELRMEAECLPKQVLMYKLRKQ